MHIMCPHCTTSYVIDSATLGATGRTVRCSRCKEVWLARPEDAAIAEMAAAGQPHLPRDMAAAHDPMDYGDAGSESDTPVVDSPSISADWPEADAAGPTAATPATEWPPAPQRDEAVATPRRGRALPGLPVVGKLPALLRGAGQPFASLPAACAAMGALVVALLVWRTDVVRLMPQTAAFYSMLGLDVNLRGLAFKDIKVSTETVDGKPVLVIEGAITPETRKPVELPRLRFAVHDAQGTEIYAWNTVLEQAILNPGERARFKSRLASPPPEGRNIELRFFNKRDIPGARA